MNETAAEALFGRILDGQMSDKEIADTLVEIAGRGETADDLVGAARALRARMIRVEAPANAIDVCGTGGDGQHSLNVSTAVALVVAACGVIVAKHGNRAASSKAGGADTLEALGLDLERASAKAQAGLEDFGISFLFAQAHHPALARIAPIRRALGRRTIFNLLGPLANPAGVKRQLIGVASVDLIPLYAEALPRLGAERAIIVSGEEGLDEFSIAGPSQFATIGIALPSGHVNPVEAGLAVYPSDAIRGGDAHFNAAALMRLVGGETGAYRDAVLFNASAALMVAGVASNWSEGVEEAAEAIDKGLAKSLLDCWIANL